MFSTADRPGGTAALVSSIIMDGADGELGPVAASRQPEEEEEEEEEERVPLVRMVLEGWLEVEMASKASSSE